MKIHLYTILYNEEDLLPFFINHYKQFVTKFFFYDNFSTDSSIEIIKNSGVDYEIRQYESNDKQDDLVFTKIKNQSWKDSKNQNVDYVIVCDMDEFLYHDNISEFLKDKKKKGITLFKPEGYNMYSDTFPEFNPDVQITEQVKNGCRFDMMDKQVIFSPDDLLEINFGMGCHTCNPTGHVSLHVHDGLKLLHYKGLSLDYLLFKVHRSKSRIPDENRKRGIGRHYFYEDQEVINAFNEYLQKSKPVVVTRKEVTFVLTSCNRPDLLELTIDSFLKYNTYPIKKYVVVEDSGKPNINDHLKSKYSHLNIVWIDNPENLGQMKSIDLAYAHVDTEYIFHCEDDWEFYRSGFIEDSMVVLESLKKIIQVWLREPNDTNGHPIEPQLYSVADKKCRLLVKNYCKVWNGFSFNPGLRRLSDYELIKPIQQYDGEPWVSVKYGELGYRAAIFEKGYVRHLGWGRKAKDSLK